MRLPHPNNPTMTSPAISSVDGSGTGVSKKAWPAPLIAPFPVIQPWSLMLVAVSNTQPELGSISVFKLVVAPSLYKNGLQQCSPPTTWPLALMAVPPTVVT